MEKTANILHREFSDNLTQLINSCGLPPFVIKDTIRSALLQVERLEDEQYRKELEAYMADANEE